MEDKIVKPKPIENPDFEEKFLFFYMQESWGDMRHVEDLRHKVSVIILAISTALIGYLVSIGNGEKIIEISNIYISIFIIILGFFGFLKTRKLYQLHQQDQARLNEWYNYIDKKWGGEVNSIKQIGDLKNQKQFWIISKFPHNHFWSILHLSISYIGFILTLDLLNAKSQILQGVIVLGIVIFAFYVIYRFLKKRK